MIYESKKCPYCRNVYETSVCRYSSENEPRWGSPLIVCGDCGKTFIDGDIEEPALKPFEISKESIFKSVIYYYPFALIGIALTVIAFEEWPFGLGFYIMTALVDFLYIFLTIYRIADRKNKVDIKRKEYEESEKRLQNPMYAKALKDAGLNVPDKYLIHK